MITESLEAALDNVWLLSDNLFLEIAGECKEIRSKVEPGVENGLQQAQKQLSDIVIKGARANALREAVNLIRWHLKEQDKHDKVPQNRTRYGWRNC